MQTSAFPPVSVYASQSEDAQLLLPHLPAGSMVVDAAENALACRKLILLPHDPEAAQHCQRWLLEQIPHRQQQCWMILPAKAGRLTPPCLYHFRPVRLPHLTLFLQQRPCLPLLPGRLELTLAEQRMLEKLYTENASVSQPELASWLWPQEEYGQLETHKLETLLYRLRRKLEESGYQITTEEEGYRLILPSEGKTV